MSKKDFEANVYVNIYLWNKHVLMHLYFYCKTVSNIEQKVQAFAVFFALY